MYILRDDMIILFYLLNAYFIILFIEPCMNLVDKTQIWYFIEYFIYKDIQTWSNLAYKTHFIVILSKIQL